MPSPPPASAADPSPVPENPPPPPVVRKFPAPCWTQDETLALIHSYQDKWYSLRRRNLRTADWEAVADEVNRRCPDQSPPKSSAQCRHKMEKLRKRYRAEKQRIGALPSHNNFVVAVHAKLQPTSIIEGVDEKGVYSIYEDEKSLDSSQQLIMMPKDDYDCMPSGDVCSGDGPPEQCCSGACVPHPTLRVFVCA
uniref:Myb-like domain-containing protein n=1 Tax=Chenopodium quinoa TaxID=63459 RepID=A0A803LUE3_CHEQI